MTTIQMVVISVLLLLVLILLILVLVRQAKLSQRGGSRQIHEDLIRLQSQVDSSMRSSAEFNSRLRSEVSDTLRKGLKTQSDQLLNASNLQTDALAGMQDRMVRTLTVTTERLRRSNEEKLDQIRGTVSEKLDHSLNERLDQNFKTIGEQLGNLYRSLGELEHLSEGVTDLNKTLSNVKTRGTWGEVQLGRILEQTLTRSQYEENIATKKNSGDRVEFAVKFPSADGEDTALMPIDSKFPSDLYNRIADAAEQGDAEALSAGIGQLKGRILDEARTIRDKYLAPPRTTNYAIMFLPTEGLYAEVLRIDGLAEKCQEMGIIIAGPTTITAILNSLQAGFRNIALSKKSVEVMKLLEAVKTQFGRMDLEVQKTQKKLSEAVSSADKLHHRTQIITRRMKQIGELDQEEAERIIDLTGTADELPDFGEEPEEGER